MRQMQNINKKILQKWQRKLIIQKKNSNTNSNKIYTKLK